MAKRATYPGTCAFCKKSYAKSGMSRHLKACAARKEVIAAEGDRKKKLFHLLVQGTYQPGFWMHLEVAAAATLFDLDRFLRDTWLECCGHLSMFKIGGRAFQVMVDESWRWGDERDMDIKLARVLEPGLKFTHEYDFGSTTYLDLRVVGEREGVLPRGEKVEMLARNDLPDLPCESCGASATVICVWCDYTLLCEECIETHECGDEGLLPVVNSPRMGVCGYTG